MEIIQRSFFTRDTVFVARALIGNYLVREIDGLLLIGIITETEAYCSDDPACHAFRGKTERTKALFGTVGHAYIYYIYGNHYCVNIVARDANQEAGGVLIRAVEPIEGMSYMVKLRNGKKDVTSGPGKLTQALHITKDLYGCDMTKKGPLYIAHNKIKNDDTYTITATPRIGISIAKDYMWRFYGTRTDVTR